MEWFNSYTYLKNMRQIHWSLKSINRETNKSITKTMCLWEVRGEMRECLKNWFETHLFMNEI